MEFTPLRFTEYEPSEMQRRAAEFSRELAERRTIRAFSERPIPENVIEHCLSTANTAPSGANMQPWHFALVRSPEMKRSLREAAEKEEQAFYGERAPEEWLEALKPFGTDSKKPFLENAPLLIAVFQKNRIIHSDGSELITYYPKESVGIATGFLIAALHHAGLATLTHTPSPMAFLNHLLDRPTSEKPFLLLVTGYPAPHCQVPALIKLPLSDVTSEH